MFRNMFRCLKRSATTDGLFARGCMNSVQWGADGARLFRKTGLDNGTGTRLRVRRKVNVAGMCVKRPALTLPTHPCPNLHTSYINNFSCLPSQWNLNQVK